MISTLPSSGEYSIERLWTPGLKAKRSLRKLGAASVSGETELGELDLLQYVNKYRSERIPIYDKQNYRAQRATEKGRGNCLAVSELWLGAISCTPHTSLFVWTGGHAMAAVRGRKNWWLADDTGYWRAGTQDVNYVSRQLDVAAHTELFETILDETAGNAFVERFGPADTATATPRWQAIKGSIGETQTPYARNTIILDPVRAVQFISAYGDITRLIMNRPDLWEQYADQIRQNIPANVAEAQIRAAQIALADQQATAAEHVNIS